MVILIFRLLLFIVRVVIKGPLILTDSGSPNNLAAQTVFPWNTYFIIVMVESVVSFTLMLSRILVISSFC